MPSTCSTLLPSEQRNSDVEAHLVVDFLIDLLIQEVLFQQVSNHQPSENLFITFVLGGPGSGKGTQCAGEILRREIASKSADGIKEGKIVPSEVAVKLIQKERKSCGNHKFLIDGFPRNDENRKAFEEIVGVEPDVVLFFYCPEEEMVKRVLNRNQGRVDDNYDTVVKRLKVFKRHNLPVIDYYATKGKLYTVNAVGTEDEIFERVRPVFTSVRKPDNISSPCTGVNIFPRADLTFSLRDRL